MNLLRLRKSNSVSGYASLPTQEIATSNHIQEPTIVATTSPYCLDDSIIKQQGALIQRREETTLKQIPGNIIRNNSFPSFFSSHSSQETFNWTPSVQDVTSNSEEVSPPSPLTLLQTIQRHKTSLQKILKSIKEGEEKFLELSFSEETLSLPFEEIITTQDNIAELEGEYLVLQHEISMQYPLFQEIIKNAQEHITIMITYLINYRAKEEEFFNNPSLKPQEKRLFQRNLEIHEFICKIYGIPFFDPKEIFQPLQDQVKKERNDEEILRASMVTPFPQEPASTITSYVPRDSLKNLLFEEETEERIPTTELTSLSSLKKKPSSSFLFSQINSTDEKVSDLVQDEETIPFLRETERERELQRKLNGTIAQKNEAERKLKNIEEEHELKQTHLATKKNIFELMLEDTTSNLDTIGFNLGSYREKRDKFLQDNSIDTMTKDLFRCFLENYTLICDIYSTLIPDLKKTLQRLTQEAECLSQNMFFPKANLEAQKLFLEERKESLNSELKIQKCIVTTLQKQQQELEVLLRKNIVLKILTEESNRKRASRKKIERGAELLYLIQNPFHLPKESEKKQFAPSLVAPLIRHTYGTPLEAFFLECFSSEKKIHPSQLRHFLRPYALFITPESEIITEIKQADTITSPEKLLVQKDSEYRPAPPLNHLELSRETLEKAGFSETEEHISLPLRVHLIRSQSQCELVGRELATRLNDLMREEKSHPKVDSVSTEKGTPISSTAILEWAQRKKIFIDWPRFQLFFGNQRIKISPHFCGLTEDDVKQFITQIEQLIPEEIRPQASLEIVKQLLAFLNSENRVGSFPTGEKVITGTTITPADTTEMVHINYVPGDNRGTFMVMQTYYGTGGRTVNTIYSPTKDPETPNTIFLKKEAPETSFLRRAILTFDAVTSEINLLSSIEAASIGRIIDAVDPQENPKLPGGINSSSEEEDPTFRTLQRQLLNKR